MCSLFIDMVQMTESYFEYLQICKNEHMDFALNRPQVHIKLKLNHLLIQS